MQSCTGPLQMSHPSCQAGQSARPWHAGCCKEGLHGSSCPYGGGLIIKTYSRRANQRRRNQDHLGLPFVGRWVWPIPLGDAALLVSIPTGAQLDLSSLETLQVILSHNTMMGEVQDQYQLMVAVMMSLQLDLSKSPDHPNSPWWFKGTMSDHTLLPFAWVNILLLNPWMNSKLSEYPLWKWNRT